MAEVQEQATILKMENIKKAFPGVQALKGVDFELKKGEVHALVGENGAGKSTLMKILMGVYEKDSGSITLEGKQIEIPTPEDAHKHGIGMIFQELSLVPQLTVGENIYLGNEFKKSGLLSDRTMYKKTSEILSRYKVDHYFDPKAKVFSLSRGYSQIVEVMKALSRETKLLVMDEPTASLTKDEEETLYQIIMNLKEQGVSIIYISHRLEEIFRNCDRVTVFRDGNRVTTENVNNVDMEQLIELMTGRKVEEERPQESHKVQVEQKAPLLEVKNLQWQPRLQNVNFHVNHGEVLGITGLMGAGKSEITRTLFGVDQPDEGEVFFDGKEHKIKNPIDAINAGMALVPEDRRYEGLVLNQSVADNIALPLVGVKQNYGFVRQKEVMQDVMKQVNSLGVKTPTLKQQVRFLSGGNQQKVVVAKWLTRKPKLLILDEPTVGVDVKTKAEIRGIIKDLVKEQDRSVLLFSSELNEIIQLADRILILYRGEIIAEYSNKVPMQEDVLHRAIQGIIQ
ncbi:MAG: sugar ABC transporter ATP-binding protein [Spirochaetales bacterium]|nr:sugar ABC transporter ATP-binding protein [Spirochaetales bacterium]MCF7938707.1 sugar ABC transporter ATP-binding protein [Spirochaetales bacterium]